MVDILVLILIIHSHYRLQLQLRYNHNHSFLCNERTQQDAKEDDLLGVAEFQEKYFGGYPTYLDRDLVFYEALGKKSFLMQPWSSWNPFQVYADLQGLGARLKDKQIEGNLKGEGIVMGGVILLTPEKDDIFAMWNEKSGTELPLEEISSKIFEMIGKTVVSDSACESKVNFFLSIYAIPNPQLILLLHTICVCVHTYMKMNIHMCTYS